MTCFDHVDTYVNMEFTATIHDAGKGGAGWLAGKVEQFLSDMPGVTFQSSFSQDVEPEEKDYEHQLKEAIQTLTQMLKNKKGDLKELKENQRSTT